MITTAPIRVRSAATVVCIRTSRRNDELRARPAVLTRKEATGGDPACEDSRGDMSGDSGARLRALFGKSTEAVLQSGYDVLMGQSEVQNWVRSSPSKPHPMRYAGEWKFAGGVLDGGETPMQAAIRELQEEFLVDIPPDTTPKLHLLSVRQTRPIQNTSNIMYNFVAAAEENPWLEELDTVSVNSQLGERRMRHGRLVADGTFWNLAKSDKEQISPEIRRVEWLDMRTAVLDTFTSMNWKFTPVNEFQLEEFARLGFPVRRDPMFLTMMSLLEVDSFPSVRALARHGASMDAESERERIQWLYPGQSPEDVATAMRKKRPAGRNGRAALWETAEDRIALFEERAEADRQEDMQRALMRIPPSKL